MSSRAAAALAAAGNNETAAPRGAAGRVAAVHRQTRKTFAVAGCFIVAAAVAAVVPHDTGSWLPLHLFLVGGVLGAIVAATQMLAVTWSAAPAPPPALAIAQRWSLVVGAAGIAIGREASSDAAIGTGGAAVVLTLVLLAVALLRVRKGAVTDRFHPAIDAYLAAVALGAGGSLVGVVLAEGGVGGADYLDARDAHLLTNLLGLVGLVIAGTLPYFAATQARVKTHPRATPARVRAVLSWLAIAVVVAASGAGAGSGPVAFAGLVAYAAGIGAVLLLLPRVGRKQLDWAGPRLVQLGAGLAWWIVAVALLGCALWFGSPSRELALRVLVVGGFAQILAASLAYFGPVLRGGGHRALTAGFALTRSWPGLVAANVAAVALAAGLGLLAGAAIGVWLLDSAVRAVVLVRTKTAAA